MLRASRRVGSTTPRSLRRNTVSPLVRDVEAEGARGARRLAGGPGAAQATHEQRVVLQRLGTVDERVQHLVVAGRGHVELLADGLLLGAGVLPPLALEVE